MMVGTVQEIIDMPCVRESDRNEAYTTIGSLFFFLSKSPWGSCEVWWCMFKASCYMRVETEKCSIGVVRFGKRLRTITRH